MLANARGIQIAGVVPRSVELRPVWSEPDERSGSPMSASCTLAPADQRGWGSVSDTYRMSSGPPITWDNEPRGDRRRVEFVRLVGEPPRRLLASVAFGSRVRGETLKDSDLDLLIVSEAFRGVGWLDC